jgi:Ca-activated chloride channel family protein
MKILMLFFLFVGELFFRNDYAQSADKIVFNDAVSSYRKGDYKNAQEKFENVVNQNPQNNRALFNAGNAAFLNGDFEKAKNYFTTYSQNSNTPIDKSRGFYNLGNVHLQEGLKAEANPQTSSSAETNFKNAVSAYKESLKYNPSDEDAKYNLTYAMNKLKQLQQQKQEQNKENQDNKENQQDQQQNDSQNKEEQNKDQQDNKDKNKDEQDDKNKEANKDKENQENPSKNEDNQEGNQEQNKQASPTKEKAKKELDALNNEEKKVLQRVAGTKSSKTSSSSNTKDW